MFHCSPCSRDKKYHLQVLLYQRIYNLRKINVNVMHHSIDILKYSKLSFLNKAGKRDLNAYTQ